MADEVKTGELVPQAGGALEQRPSFIAKDDRTGTEDISADELRLPRLAIAQGLSPQMTPDSSFYIEGLKLYDLFNDMSGEIYGRGPVKFIPLKRNTIRIEFDPEQRGVVLDRDVPKDDPRNDWTEGEDGQRIPPRATTYVEFVSLLVKEDGGVEPIVISIKCTNKFATRAAERLTGFIKFRNAPIYAGVYTIKTRSERSDAGPFGVYVVDNAGFVQNEALYMKAKELHESLEGKTIVVQREAAVDDTSFDTTEM